MLVRAMKSICNYL